jgi:hypothetical protein
LPEISADHDTWNPKARSSNQEGGWKCIADRKLLSIYYNPKTFITLSDPIAQSNCIGLAIASMCVACRSLLPIPENTKMERFFFFELDVAALAQPSCVHSSLQLAMCPQCAMSVTNQSLRQDLKATVGMLTAS